MTGEKTAEFPELSPSSRKKSWLKGNGSPIECMDEYACNFTGRKSGPVTIWYGMGVAEQNATIKAMILRWKPARQKPVPAKSSGLQPHVHIIVSRMDRSQTVSLPPPSKAGETGRFLTAWEVVVGFDCSQWSARCASCVQTRQLYGYFPTAGPRMSGLKEYSGEWEGKERVAERDCIENQA